MDFQISGLRPFAPCLLLSLVLPLSHLLVRYRHSILSVLIWFQLSNQNSSHISRNATGLPPLNVGFKEASCDDAGLIPSDGVKICRPDLLKETYEICSTWPSNVLFLRMYHVSVVPEAFPLCQALSSPRPKYLKAFYIDARTESLFIIP